MQIVNRLLRHTFAGWRTCEWCRRPGFCVGHHLWRKGMGGGAWLDLRINLVSLCPECHDEADAYKITRSDLLAIVAQREGCLQRDIEAVIERLRRRRA
jgi:hypothetical protein